jgi:hypothetical protein
MPAKEIGLTESQILEVQKHARSAKEAARMLGVSYLTYKKYAKMFGVFENLLNPTGVGISKGFAFYKKYPLDEILEGKHPGYNINTLKKRLIKSDEFEHKCDICGFDEERITDGKRPLILDFVDDDKTNHRRENVRFLCYNCYFLNVGNINKKRYDIVYPV